MRIVLIWAAATLVAAAESILVSGQPPPSITLEGRSGGLAAGGAWDSASVRGRMQVMFYVDPDEKDLNEHVGEAIQREAFPGEQFGTVAVINMAATRIPNLILNRMLASKQRKYPRTTYVKDYDRSLVRAWGLRDDSYDVLVFDEEGRLLKAYHGRLSDADLDELLGFLRAGVKRLQGKG